MAALLAGMADHSRIQHLSLRGAQRRSNLAGGAASGGRDCFAALAMTNTDQAEDGWKQFASSARMTARTCARCWPMSRTAASCACAAIRSSPSPPGSPAPRSIATPSSSIRRSASRRRCAAPAPRARAGSRRSPGTRRSTRSPRAGNGSSPKSGPLALLGYAYSAHQGQMNRGLMLGLFHALGASRLIAGTVCDTCCEEAWNLTVGPVGGADPEAVDDSDLIVAWGADLVATNVHFWAKAEAARRRGVKIVVIDPRRSRTARQADRHLQIRIGTDAALALGVMHILARDGLVDRDYVAAHTTRLRPARSRGAAPLSAGACRRDHRPCRGRHRGLCACLWRREAVVYPARRGHDAAGARRRGAARGGAASRRDRRLWKARRRRAAADRGFVRAELRRAAAPVRTRRDPARQPFAARRGAARRWPTRRCAGCSSRRTIRP